MAGKGAAAGGGPVLARPGGVAHRLAILALLGVVLCAARLRAHIEVPRPRPPCEARGRGEPPRHWLGCAGDPGPDRALRSDERLVLGLPVDLNVAGALELAFVPGLSRRLAAEIVLDRERNGPFLHVDELIRVRGVGPKKLHAARPHLFVPDL